MASAFSSSALQRLERRVRRAVSIKAAGRRVWESTPAMAQIVVAASAAYAVAHWGFGHASPVLAVTVTVASLGFNRDARPVQVLRSVLGVLLGVVLAAAFIAVAGRGPWQLVVVLTLALVAGRLLSSNPAFAVAVAIPSALLVLTPDPESGPFTRVLDAVIAGVLALLVTALIPRNPRRLAAKDATALFSVLVESTNSVVECLRDGDAAAGDLALARLRRTQPLIDAWHESLESAQAITRISPFLRRQLPALDRAARAYTAADLAARHLRPIARRCRALADDGTARPVLGELLATVGKGIALVGAEIEDLELVGAARSLLTDLAARLMPNAVPSVTAGESAVVLQLRPLVVDLLVATGMSEPEARRMLVKV